MPPKDEVRPCASRSASHSASELDADSVARGASEAGAEGAEGPGASAAGCEPAEAAEEAESTVRQMEGAKKRCEPRAMKAASAGSKKALRLSPWGTKVGKPP